jgi:hypothetical protein
MKFKASFIFVLASAFALVSCKKSEQDDQKDKVYFEVGFKHAVSDWRDSSFVVASSSPQIIQQAEAQLSLPVAERKIVFGKLQGGNGGYNRNASHQFKWHFKDDEWSLVDVTIEIYDGRPYSDLDSDTSYWLNTMTIYGSWSSYIKRKLPAQQNQ